MNNIVLTLLEGCLEAEKDNYHPNMKRKIDSKDLPEQVSGRLKNENMALKFEVLRKDLRERTGNNGNQKTIEYIINLAWIVYRIDKNLNTLLDIASGKK